jgi:signal peptidase I
MNNEQLPIKEEQAKGEKREHGGTLSFLFDILEMFAWSLFVVFLLFTFCIRLCRVDGSSMENTLYGGDNLLVYSLNYTPAQDDISVFHLTNPQAGLEKTLVKRVIATGGQSVTMNYETGEIHVDGVLYDDSHAVLKSFFGEVTGKYDRNYPDHHFDYKTKVMSFTVPESRLFVLGDNRNDSKDSRNADIMFVDEDCVLGRVFLRLSPFTIFS